MIEIDNEMKGVMDKLGTALEKVRPMYYDKARRYFRHDGEPVKLYARRGKDLINYNVKTEKETQKILDWCLEVIERIFNLRVSTSILFRRALLSYQTELLDLLMGQTGHNKKALAQFMIKLEAEREKLYGVSKRENVN